MIIIKVKPRDHTNFVIFVLHFFKDLLGYMHGELEGPSIMFDGPTILNYLSFWSFPHSKKKKNMGHKTKIFHIFLNALFTV